MAIQFPNMSKKNSSKELLGVYKRCLSALNQVRDNLSSEVVISQKMVEKMVRRASWEANGLIKGEKLQEEDRTNWIKARVSELVSLKRATLCVKSKAAARAEIEALMRARA